MARPIVAKPDVQRFEAIQVPYKLGADMSRWGGDMTRKEAQCFKDNGVETIIVAVGPGGYGSLSQSQVDDAIAVGINIEAYSFLEFGHDPEIWVRQALESIGTYRELIKRWWLDVEDNDARDLATYPTVASRIAYVQKALDEFQRNGIFAHYCTGRWYHTGWMGNTTVFSEQGRLLFNMSRYDGDPDIDDVDFGGWTKETTAIEQYRNTHVFCGQSIDADAIYIAPEDEHMAGAFVTRDEFNLLCRAIFVGKERGEISGEDAQAIIDDELATVGTKPSVAESARTAMILALDDGIDDDMTPEELQDAINLAISQKRFRLEEADTLDA